MLTVTEYRPAEIALDEPDLAYLLDMTRGAGGERPRVIEALTPTRSPGVYSVTAGPYVGRLGLPSGQVLDIASRLPFASVLALLRLSGRLPALAEQTPAELGAAPFLVDALAHALVQAAETLAAQGLAKSYVRRHFERPPYPGTIDVARHLGRHAGREDRLVTTAKRISVDVPVNQALKAGVRILSRVGTTEPLPVMLRRADSMLGAVTSTRVSAADVGRLQLDRMTERYRGALGLVALVLSGEALAPAGRAWSGSSMLFDMTRVWEDCVTHWVANTWPAAAVVPQYSFHVGNDRTLPAYADTMVLVDGAPAAVYDAKYKPDEGPRRGDLYQMVTYATRLGLREATLVYPFVASPWQVRVGEITVRGVGVWPDAAVLESSLPELNGVTLPDCKTRTASDVEQERQQVVAQRD